MDWRAVLVGVAWGAGYLAVCYLLPALEGVGLVGVPLLLGSGPLAGAAAGRFSRRGPAESTRHGLAAGTLTGLVFAVAFWHVISVSRFHTLTPFGHGGAFFALKLTYVYSASDFPVIARHPGRIAGAFALLGAVAIVLLAGYAGYVASIREKVEFIG